MSESYDIIDHQHDVVVVGAGGSGLRATRGLADMAIMPFVRQFAATDREWFDAQALPSLQRWLAAHLASDLFAAIMVRHAPWQPDDAPIAFPA